MGRASVSIYQEYDGEGRGGLEERRSPNRRQGEVGAADTAQSLELQIELPRHTVNNYHGLASLSCLRPYRSCRGSHSPAGARLMTKLNFSRSFPCPCTMIMIYCGGRGVPDVPHHSLFPEPPLPVSSGALGGINIFSFITSPPPRPRHSYTSYQLQCVLCVSINRIKLYICNLASRLSPEPQWLLYREQATLPSHQQCY